LTIPGATTCHTDEAHLPVGDSIRLGVRPPRPTSAIRTTSWASSPRLRPASGVAWSL